MGEAIHGGVGREYVGTLDLPPNFTVNLKNKVYLRKKQKERKQAGKGKERREDIKEEEERTWEAMCESRPVIPPQWPSDHRLANLTQRYMDSTMCTYRRRALTSVSSSVIAHTERVSGR